MNTKSNKAQRFPIAIVGTGPGSLDLLTVLAKERIEHADIVLYDCLPAHNVIELASQYAEVIFVEKHHEKDLLEIPASKISIIDLMIQYHQLGKKVVRLKAGDAMMFGGGAKECQILRNLDVPYEVIPGISAGAAAANIFAIPLSEKNQSNGVIFAIGDAISDDFAHFRDIAQILKHGSTLILYMAFDNLNDIFRVFREEGISSDMPALAVAMASLPDEDCVCGTISDILPKMEQREMLLPVTFYIGKYVTNLIEAKAPELRIKSGIGMTC